MRYNLWTVSRFLPFLCVAILISFDLNKTTFISTHACVRVCAHIWTHIHVPQPVYGGQRTKVGSLCVGPGDGTQLTGAVPC